ncbi:hypothetical protein J3R30DRAFT_3360759 [Lentinula aciculospora]|uniref:Uncharacterized protein n=1 Tax=Lentinula aciculospora TaxID=153920 RepID=A0A9W9ATB4_9AGAR|nr:hypothetical protein J3R30DRAFT_3360759 [Lentinula aciculospora]
MEDNRAKTLQALSTFIDKQRALLTRTHADISRLSELRSRAVKYPENFANDFSEQFNDGAFKISELEEVVDSLPEGIEWSLFSKHNPAPLQALAAKSKQQPPPTTTPSLSEFQRHIREAKSKILDPVFSTWNLSFNPLVEPDDDEMKGQPPTDPAALKKAKEREKIKGLKKHKITPGLTFTPSGHRTRGPGGVFIRRDVVDESMDVDISLDIEGSSKPIEPIDPSPSFSPATGVPCPFPTQRRASVTPQQLPSTPPTPLDEPSSTHQSIACIKSSHSKSLSIKVGVPPALSVPPLTTRQRRRLSKTISSCPSDMNVDDSAFPPTPDSLPLPETEPEPENSAEKDPLSVLGKRSRPKSETYKQAWSTSEQQLLEALLEEIPEGEKNRWKKISKAMNGRRTPRQVASRVQKYFEKLKKFGIE